MRKNVPERILFEVAFFLRAAAALLRQNPWGGGDSSAYVQMAGWLRNGSSTMVLGHPPVYPIFLLFFYILPHFSITLALIAQSLVGALTVVMSYRLSRRWTSARVALLTCAIVAFDPFQIYFTSLFLSETLFTFLLISGFYVLTGLTSDSPHIARSAASGFLFALSALCRTILSPFLPFLALSILYLVRGSFFRTLKLIVAFMVGIAVPMVLWSAYLHHRTGYWIFVAPQKGWNCYEGLNPNFDQPAAIHEWQRSMWRDIEVEGLKDPVQMDHYFWAKSVRIVKQDPIGTLELMVRKFFKFWRFWPYFPYALRERIISAIFMLFLIPFALLGLWTTWKGHGVKKPAVLLVAFIAVYSVANTITWTEIRYRVPLHPMIAIFSAVGLSWLLSFIKEPSA